MKEEKMEHCTVSKFVCFLFWVINKSGTVDSLLRCRQAVRSEIGSSLQTLLIIFQNFQKSAPTEAANKSGSLNSKCAACRSHVHLVQRHFVEGKLYHRSCFK